ncbi:MAG: UDP-glucose/GDP-mannose dehydrogenase family protein [Verrucomicrobia bacterium]|nr:UDP-glucose/GDP-mannose dehydrogenase family protein [Verrucomicrobiota bacterium]
MKPIQNISVFGLGKLGACIAATLAARGFDVLGVDIDPEKVRRVNEGLPPVDEPLLADMITAGRARLRATTNHRDAARTDASFFIPPSPSLPDGSFSNEHLLKAMQPIAKAVREADNRGHLFICSSTTTPGAVDGVLIPMLETATGWKAGRDFGMLYNPEFIALGNVIAGLLDPDMVLIGESDKESGDRLEALYQKYNRNQPNLARMSIISAEIAKISLNSYITMKISYTNQLRLIAERFPKANIHDILDAIGSDSRIGRKYLRAGLTYGGPCFPRDNRLLAYTARMLGLEAPLAVAADRVNELAKQKLLENVKALLKPGETAAVLGLSYKPDTYITEESAGLHLAQNLKRAGYRVLVHDYAAKPAVAPALHEFENLDDPAALKTMADVKVAVLCCPWPQYKTVHFHPNTQVVAKWKL